MKILLLSNSIKAKFGLGLAGVESIFISSSAQAEHEWEKAIGSESIGIILMDQFIYESLSEKIQVQEQKLDFPLIIVIPRDEHDKMIGDNLSKLIREAIGIKV